MSKYLIAAVVLGGLSVLSLSSSTAGVVAEPSAFAFDRLHAGVASLAAVFAALLGKVPSRRSVAVMALSLAVLTLGLGLLESALVGAAALDGRGLRLNSFASGPIFLAQGLCTLRALRLRVVFERTDPPSGPGPFAPA